MKKNNIFFPCLIPSMFFRGCVPTCIWEITSKYVTEIMFSGARYTKRGVFVWNKRSFWKLSYRSSKRMLLTLIALIALIDRGLWNRNFDPRREAFGVVDDCNGSNVWKLTLRMPRVVVFVAVEELFPDNDVSSDIPSAL